MTSTVKTRVLIISDTHCAALTSRDDSNPPFPPFKAPLPKADLLIHCGDLTYDGQLEQYERTLDMLKEVDAPVKLVIAGNHDLSLDRDFIFSHMKQQRLTQDQADSKLRQAWDFWTAADGRAKREGVTYLSEGLHQVDLRNGAHIGIYASRYTPEFCDWGFPYKRSEDRYNPPATTLSDAENIAPHPVPSFSMSEPSVDIMVTHGPPYNRMDKTDKGDLAGCPHLLRAVMRAKPLIHCFGHIHEGWGAEIVDWSSEADEASTSAMSTAEWKAHGWKAGVKGDRDIATIAFDHDKLKEDHAAFLDISNGAKCLIKGEQTAMVNAAIMDPRYRPSNAPIIVDVDLPKGPRGR